MAKDSLGQYQIEWVPLSAVREHPQNPRIGEVEKIAQSIEENDFFTPIIAQRSTRYIIIGNHRWKGAKEVGLTLIPVIFHDVPDVRAKAIMLADNRSSDKSRYRDDALIELLDEMAELDELEATLFTEAELEGLKGIDDAYDDDDQPDRQEQAEYKRRVTECPRCAHVFVPDTFVEREDR